MVHVNGLANRRTIRSQRRSRPGMHERRSLPRKETLSYDFSEAISEARDSTVLLPFEYAKPSPLRRQTFDQSWQRWKAREAEHKEKLVAEREEQRRQLESEQVRLFGGDVDDDALRSLGILYNDSESQDIKPQYTLRYVQERPRRRRNAVQLELPPFLAASILSDDSDIARLMAPSVPAPLRSSPDAPVQHDENVSTPSRSLPPPLSDSSTISSDYSRSASPIFQLFPTSLSIPDSPVLEIQPPDADTSWDFLSSNLNTPTTHTPASEPETWILLSDDS